MGCPVMVEMMCPSCGKRLQWLEETKVWYCGRCDKMFLPSEQDPSRLEEVEPKRREARNLTAEQKRRLLKQYDAVYIDGFVDMGMDTATISVLSDLVHIFFENHHYELSLPYSAIDLLTLTQEREITALRTFLIGPLLAAAFKKRTRVITIGWRDELGLLHLPSFKMAEDEYVGDCYATIWKRLKEVRLRKGSDAGTEDRIRLDSSLAAQLPRERLFPSL